jgi:hypothetical protein
MSPLVPHSAANLKLGEGFAGNSVCEWLSDASHALSITVGASVDWFSASAIVELPPDLTSRIIGNRMPLGEAVHGSLMSVPSA